MPDPDPVKLTLKGDSVILCAKRVSDGEFIPLVVNDDGTLADSGVTTLNEKFTDGTADNNVGEAVSKTVKSGAGRLLSLSVRHAHDSALYLWIFNNTEASGTSLIVPTFIPASSHVVIGTDFFTTKGLAFSTGLTYGFSTSGASYSAHDTDADCFATVVYS